MHQVQDLQTYQCKHSLRSFNYLHCNTQRFLPDGHYGLRGEVSRVSGSGIETHRDLQTLTNVNICHQCDPSVIRAVVKHMCMSGPSYRN